MREEGTPLSRDELFEKLAERDIVIHGNNPPVVLQTMLWRMQERIVHLKGHGYWPREDADMAADYVGGTEPEESEDLDSLI
ncbi:hypothetical protein ACOTTU_14260 [Roseobacter sp. EG26]|uniref:hypothetical protein n=1 Tax=Roseobacter sp. EG26 TaxID=3412477 RepID=UPI003CE468CC